MIAFEIVSTIAVVTIAIFMIINKTPKYDKVPETYNNLITALKGENTAKLKYEEFAKVAEQEGNTALVKLFLATADAEDIHIQKEYALADDVKPLAMPSSDEYSVGDSAANLQSCIEAEIYESQTMYPEFFEDAEKEGFRKAKKIFRYARDAEKSHADLFNEMLSQLSEKGLLADDIQLYLCPVCGKLELGSKSAFCSVCGTPGFMFSEY